MQWPNRVLAGGALLISATFEGRGVTTVRGGVTVMDDEDLRLVATSDYALRPDGAECGFKLQFHRFDRT